ncbi:hypothetical protein B9Z65_7368 [Elsinoe australis]|uniref:DUF7928 domain-containing protein n=1 Tax=Elsinoe australis TaxID=40998 RepID=A0A2P7YBY4_9PEZI|nr:hypothetical protein B9Z65_7368 [Elsinoe australis]
MRQDSATLTDFEAQECLQLAKDTSTSITVVITEDCTPQDEEEPFDIDGYDNQTLKPLAQARFLHQTAVQNDWLQPFHEDIYCGSTSLGAFVRNAGGSYCQTTNDYTVLRAVDALTPGAALTFSSRLVSMLMQWVCFDQKEINISYRPAIAVVDTIDDITTGKVVLPAGTTQCLCRQEHFILVWGASSDDVLEQASDLQIWLLRVGRDYVSHRSMTLESPMSIHRLEYFDDVETPIQTEQRHKAKLEPRDARL